MGIERRGFGSHPENINKTLGSRQNPFKAMIKSILAEDNADWLKPHIRGGIGDTSKMNVLEAVVRNCVVMAVGKNNSRAIEAIRFLAEYTVGRPKQQLDVSIAPMENPYEDMDEDEIKAELRRLEGDIDSDTFDSDTVEIVNGKKEDTSQYRPVVIDKKLSPQVDS